MRSDKDVRELREKLMELNDRFQEMGGEVDEEMGDRLRAFKDSISDRSGQMWREAKRKGRVMDNYVRENPWQVVGGAFVLGCVVGMLVVSRRNR